MEVISKNPLYGRIFKKITLRRVYGMTCTDLHPSRKESLMIEKMIERKLTLMVKNRGGVCLKFISPGFAGVPDRIVLLPDGCVAFVEVKAYGEKPRPLQTSRHKLLRQLGFKVYVLDDPEQIGGILDEIHPT